MFYLRLMQIVFKNHTKVWEEKEKWRPWKFENYAWIKNEKEMCLKNMKNKNQRKQCVWKMKTLIFLKP